MLPAEMAVFFGTMSRPKKSSTSGTVEGLGVFVGVGVFEGVEVWLAVTLEVALQLAVVLDVGVGERLGVLDCDLVGVTEGVAEGVMLALGVMDEVGVGVEVGEGVMVAEGEGVGDAETQTAAEVCPGGRPALPCGQKVHDAWPGPLHEPDGQIEQFMAEAGSCALALVIAPPEADHAPLVPRVRTSDAPA